MKKNPQTVFELLNFLKKIFDFYFPVGQWPPGFVLFFFVIQYSLIFNFFLLFN